MMGRSDMQGSLGSAIVALIILNIRGERAWKKLRVEAILKR